MIRDSMFGMKAPEIERWSDRVVVVRGLNPGPFTGPGTNTYLVGRGGTPLLIDTGSGVAGYPDVLARALDQEFGCDAPGDILVTHAHPDHLGGTPQLIERFGARAVQKMPWPERDARFRVEIHELAGGDVVRAPDATLRAIHCPGHAQDHLCFYLEEERALFTGDVVLGAGTTVIPLDGGDMGLYLDSLARILALDLATIYPGHGPRIDEPKAKVQAYIDHRLEREAAIVRAIREGAHTIQEMVERIYVDTPRALHPAAGQSVLSHLHKLERDGRASQRVDPAGEGYWTVG